MLGMARLLWATAWVLGAWIHGCPVPLDPQVLLDCGDPPTALRAALAGT